MRRRLQVDFVCLLQAVDLLLKPLSGISAIHPYLAQPLDTIGKIRTQQLDQSEAIIHAGIGHHHGNDQP